MFEEYTLRWYDPFFTWGDHSNYYESAYTKTLKNFDTGLCNRLFHWEVASEINKNHGNIFTILLQNKIWPELHILDLPKSQPAFYNKLDFHFLHGHNFESLHFKTVYDLEKDNVRLATKVDREKLNDLIFKKNSLKNETHFYSDFGFVSLDTLYNEKNKMFNPDNRHIKKIKLKHRQIENIISNYTKDCVGLHIRRNNGVKISDEDYNKMEPFIKQKYLELEKRKNVVGKYTFYGDDLYFDVIEKFLKINPEQKFFISDDLPDGFINYYKHKFGPAVIKTRDEIMFEITEYYYSSGIDVLFLENYGRVISNVIDLFCLCNCKFLVLSPNSTWSKFAQFYKNKPFTYIDQPINKIILDYNSSELKKLF